MDQSSSSFASEVTDLSLGSDDEIFEEQPEARRIYFQPFDWRAEEATEMFPATRKLMVRCWAKDTEGKNVYIHFSKYKYEMYVEIPATDKFGKCIFWAEDLAFVVVEQLKRELASFPPVSIEFVRKSTMRTVGWKKPVCMLRLSYEKKHYMHKSAKLLREGIDCGKDLGNLKFLVHETNVPVLTKLFSNYDLRPTQWLSAICCPVTSKYANVDLEKCQEYVGDVTTLLPENEMGEGVKPCKVLSFDLECYSSRGDQVFPSPVVEGDEVFMISAVFQHSNDRASRKCNLFTLFDVKDCQSRVEECPEYDLIVCKNELELIESFCRMVNEEDPDVIIGHNIWQFDMRYLYARCKLSLDKRLPSMDRTKYASECKLTSTARLNTNNKDVISKEIGFKSSGNADFSKKVHAFNMEGRISLDVMEMIEKDHKLETYTLNNIAKHFLGSSKVDVTAKDMFVSYRQCRQLSSSLEEEEMMMQVDLMDEEELEVVEEAKKTERETLNLMKKISDYCIVDSTLVMDLFDHQKMWISIMVYAKIFGITPYHIVSKGQQARCISTVYSKACTKGIVLDYPEKTNSESSLDSFKGGAVAEPVAGVHDLVLVLDFCSLYPSIIRQYNICPTTYVPEDKWHMFAEEEYTCVTLEGDDDEDDGGQFPEEEKYRKKFKQTSMTSSSYQIGEGNSVQIVGKKSSANSVQIKFLKRREGIFPELCRTLTVLRKAVKSKMKSLDEKSEEWAILNCKQLALKVSSNSLYGSMGFPGGALSMKEAAMAITSCGRNLVHGLRDLIKSKWGGREIYGDTDSTMVTLDEKLSWNQESCIKCGKEIESYINGELGNCPVFGESIRVEFEKAMKMMAIKKKKYCYYSYDMSLEGKYLMEKSKEGVREPKLFCKGIIINRRDSIDAARIMYKKLVDCALADFSKVEVLTMMAQDAISIITSKDVDLFKSTMRCNTFTVSKTSPGAVFADRMKAMGKPLQNGTRFQYVIVTQAAQEGRRYLQFEEDKLKTGEKMMLVEEFKDKQEEYVLDTMYYLNNKVKEVVDNLCFTIYGSTSKQKVKMSGSSFWASHPVESVLKMSRVFPLNNILCKYKEILANPRHI